MSRHRPYLEDHPRTTLTEQELISHDGRAYVLPEIPMIGDGAAKLYKLEGQLADALEACTHEQAAVMNLKATRRATEGAARHSKTATYWERALPESLGALLASQERASAIAAAVGFLRREGFIVHQPTTICGGLPTPTEGEPRTPDNMAV